jgi:pyruvate/2-oxoglutarate dehydrogenase complex dihydrolipoamide acyltransferase (E2) component
MALLVSIALGSTATVLAQPPVPAPQTTTLTGCVTGGSKSQPITLMNALVLPPGAVSPAPDTAQPASEAAAPPPPAAATPAVGAAASVQGTAPAGSSPSSVGGYRLSGTDMTAWIGRRVQIVGTLVSSPASSATPTGTSGSTKRGPEFLPMPEFRVVSVQPITGACPAK